MKVYTVNELIDSLSALNGQTVSVHGVLAVRREDHSISHLPADERRADRKSSLWVNFHHASLGTRGNQLSKFDGREIIATGVLDISRKGHFRSFPGSLTIRSLAPDEHEPCRDLGLRSI